MSRLPIPAASGTSEFEEQNPPDGSGVAVGAGVAVWDGNETRLAVAEGAGVLVGTSVGNGVRVGRSIAVGSGEGVGLIVGTELGV